MMRWLASDDDDSGDRFRCEAKDIETQLGQAASLFDAFRVSVDRLSQALLRQTATEASSSSSHVYSNKHITTSQDDNASIYNSSSSHPHYRDVSGEETAKLLASTQALAEDLKRI